MLITRHYKSRFLRLTFLWADLRNHAPGGTGFEMLAHNLPAMASSLRQQKEQVHRQAVPNGDEQTSSPRSLSDASSRSPGKPQSYGRKMLKALLIDIAAMCMARRRLESDSCRE